MWFGEPHPFPERGSPTGLSASGQQSYEGWSCRIWLSTLCTLVLQDFNLSYKERKNPYWRVAYTLLLCLHEDGTTMSKHVAMDICHNYILKPTRCINVANLFYCSNSLHGRSQWPRGLRRRSAAARLLRSWVRIPLGVWMSVCCECCVLWGRGLCNELITRPEESYRMWCVVECDLETSRMRRPWPTLGRSPTGGKSTQHVSDGLSVHHQQVKTVHTATVKQILLSGC